MILRGIERRAIFYDDADRVEFLDRLDHALAECDVRGFAWALMPNHVHLVLRRGRVPLARAMARVGTGYAVVFNRRHERSGYLFQNRYKSLDVEDERHLLTLIRYVHLNPVRANLVSGLEALACHPWTGHTALVGGPRYSFHDVEATLGLFGQGPNSARHALLDWMRVPEPPPTERAEVLGRPAQALRSLLIRIASEYGVSARRILAGDRARDTARARAVLVHRACDQVGLTQLEVAHGLGLSPAGVTRARRRGRRIDEDEAHCTAAGEEAGPSLSSTK